MADVVTTVFALGRGATELNPFFKDIGNNMAVVCAEKLLLAGIWFAFLTYAHHRSIKENSSFLQVFLEIIATATLGFYAFIVFNNVIVGQTMLARAYHTTDADSDFWLSLSPAANRQLCLSPCRPLYQSKLDRAKSCP